MRPMAQRVQMMMKVHLQLTYTKPPQNGWGTIEVNFLVGVIKITADFRN